MFIRPKAFPEEFRRDVVAVARKGEAPITQIAKDFGVSPAALHRWMKIADKEDGVALGAVSDDAAEPREANKRIRLLEQEAGTIAKYRRVAAAHIDDSDLGRTPVDKSQQGHDVSEPFSS